MRASKYKSYSDAELISMCLNGEANAWESLIARYRRLIYSVPVRFGLEAADAADVFQSVCLKLLEHLHELKDERRLIGWLITTTTRQCMHVRSLKTREPTKEDSDLVEPEDPALNMEELRIQTEQEQTLRDVVDGMPERCRVLINMLYFDNRALSYDEISRELGMPVASIGPTRSRCLDKLRILLRRRGIR